LRYALSTPCDLESADYTKTKTTKIDPSFSTYQLQLKRGGWSGPHHTTRTSHGPQRSVLSPSKIQIC